MRVVALVFVSLLGLLCKGQSLGRPTAEPDYVQFLTSPHSHVVLINSDVRMDCEITRLQTGIPVMWSNGSDIISTNDMVFSGKSSVDMVEAQSPADTGLYTLVIPDVQLMDEGDYTCQVPGTPPTGGSVTHSLTVNIPASVYLETEDNDVELEVGGSHKMRCYGDGKPIPSIQWRHLSNSPGLQNQLFDSDELILSDVTPMNSGNYECIAKNGAGIPATATVTVHVRYAPEVSVDEKLVYTAKGESVTLVCTFLGSPEVSVKWMHNGSELVLGDRSNLQFRESTQQEKTNSVVQINSLRPQDLGEYKCIGVNNRGSVQADIVLSADPHGLEITSPPESSYSDEYTLSWEVSSMSQLVEFHMRFHEVNETSAGETWVNSTIPAPLDHPRPTHTQSRIIKGLQSNMTYIVKLRARNLYGLTDWTEEFIFHTPQEDVSAPIHTTLPTTPKEPTEPKHRPLQDESKLPGGITDAAPASLPHLITTLMVTMVTLLVAAHA